MCIVKALSVLCSVAVTAGILSELPPKCRRCKSLALAVRTGGPRYNYCCPPLLLVPRAAVQSKEKRRFLAVPFIESPSTVPS